MNIAKYLRGQGYDTVDAAFYRLIFMWESWYRGKARNFHRYRIYNGKSYVSQQRYSLGMAKQVCEDLANMLMNEKVGITVSDQRAQSYIEEVFAECDLRVKLNAEGAEGVLPQDEAHPRPAPAKR